MKLKKIGSLIIIGNSNPDEETLGLDLDLIARIIKEMQAKGVVVNLTIEKVEVKP